MTTKLSQIAMDSYKPLTGPIKSNDINYMYNYCKRRIQTAENHQQLLPIIKTLIPMDKLQNKLIEIIDELYQNLTTTTSNGDNQQSKPQSNVESTSNNNHNDENKSSALDQSQNQLSLTRLYLNSSSIAEIFPDQILVSIIQYIDPKDKCYNLLPALSKDFLHIMTKYPILYHHYKLVIDEIPMHYNTQCIKLHINHAKKSIYIKLAELEVDSVGMEATSSVSSLMFTASFDRFVFMTTLL